MATAQGEERGLEDKTAGQGQVAAGEAESDGEVTEARVIEVALDTTREVLVQAVVLAGQRA